MTTLNINAKESHKESNVLSLAATEDQQLRQRVVILGAGPAGLGAAWQLARNNKADVLVIEQRDDVGGNAGSFELEGIRVDYGSHRLHSACDPQILSDLRALLHDDLLDRPRHGRIRLRQRWIHFPLKPADLLLHLPPAFGVGVALDAVGKLASRSSQANGKEETFTSVLEHGLGSTICRDFYFPYALKVWGLPPEELSAIQARRRVSAGSLSKLARKVLSLLPGLKASPKARFFYPQQGYGQISRALASAARDHGVDLRLQTTVKRISLGSPHEIEIETDGEVQTVDADHLWSTIPISVLARITTPAAPKEVIDASKRLEFRAMILVYLALDIDQWTPFDAHYFPEADIRLTRLSEPKNYSGSSDPRGRTVLCGELPCMVGDDVWGATDAELGELVCDSLAKCGLPVQANILSVTTRRLPYAYPIYRRSFERYFEALDTWASGLDDVLTFGRQGLFAHDNTHHALAMAYAAVDCFEQSGLFDATRWQSYRAEFAKHVVED
jgi:protoporphyrinogen oxidase